MKEFIVNLSRIFTNKQWEDPIYDSTFVRNVGILSNSAYKDIISGIDNGVLTIIENLDGYLSFVLPKLLGIKRRYAKEIQLMSKISGENVLYANLSYELAKMSGLEIGFSWCSSVAANTEAGPVHSRNLDWPLNGLKNKTIMIDFEGAKAGSFTSVTFPGFSGVLTGMAPDRFSASINMMIEDYGFYLIGTPIALLVREMFETCHTFDEAYDFLMNADVFAPAFVHLVGTEDNENTVVGVMTNEYENFAYEPDKYGLCCTNHIPDSDFDDDENEVNSVERLNYANIEIEKVNTFQQIHGLMRKPPLKNEETKHTVTMCASSGHILAK